MAQTGLHALVGLGTAFSGLVPRERQKRRAFVFGLVLGNFIPDTDFFVVCPVYLINTAFGTSLHRSVTHSLLSIGLVLLVSLLLMVRKKQWGYLGLGLGIGMLMHSSLDLLMWFYGVDFLWPLGYFGVHGKVSLWPPVPEWIDNLVNNTGDYVAFALYFMALRALARRFGTNRELLPRLSYWISVLWWLAVPYALFSFFTTRDNHDIAHYALYFLVFLPLCLYYTFKMRPTIDALADSVRPVCPEKSAVVGHPR